MMPRRHETLSNKSIYHVFNKTLNRVTPFESSDLKDHLLDTAHYYRSTEAKVSYSLHRKRMQEVGRDYQINLTSPNTFRVEVLAYNLLPNHYHFLLLQKMDNGVSDFMRLVGNSFTKFFNTKFERSGPLFRPMFKAIPILTAEQLMHGSRYVHLQQFSQGTAMSMKDQWSYEWSSLKDYQRYTRAMLTNPKVVLDLFYRDPERYKSFVNDRADYQRTLEILKKNMEK